MKLEKGEFSDLLAVDQLNTARKDGTAFSHLDETLPTFAPTYKFKVRFLTIKGFAYFRIRLNTF